MKLTRENPRTWGKKPVPVPLCPPQIPHGLIWDRTRVSAVRGRRTTVWAMARPVSSLSTYFVFRVQVTSLRHALWPRHALGLLSILNYRSMLLAFVCKYRANWYTAHNAVKCKICDMLILVAGVACRIIQWRWQINGHWCSNHDLRRIALWKNSDLMLL